VVGEEGSVVHGGQRVPMLMRNGVATPDAEESQHAEHRRHAAKHTKAAAVESLPKRKLL
jgi:hypothetical protein